MTDNPIYKAQCFGNVEPIEYMVPYPNLRSLAVGQCIKFADGILYKEQEITNNNFLKSINQYSNWLVKRGINRGNKVLIKNLSSPEFDILCYAIWSIGAVLVLSEEKYINNIEAKMIIDSRSKLDLNQINLQSYEYVTTSNTLLNDIAVVFYHNGVGIKLSHYNLLINAYGIFKELNILHKNSLKVDIPKNSTTYLVLNTILPLYAGTSITQNDASITFGQNNDADFQIKFNWEKIESTEPQSLYVLPETTAILAMGNKPNHLLSIKEENSLLKINGHSVMMGYTDENKNNDVFKSGSLIISK